MRPVQREVHYRLMDILAIAMAIATFAILFALIYAFDRV
jgi:ABC-type phosphate/phosphonate transport system permease subunit